MARMARYSTSVRLTPEQDAAVRAEAKKSGKSVSQVLGEAVDEYLLMRGPVESVQGLNTELGRG